MARAVGHMIWTMAARVPTPAGAEDKAASRGTVSAGRCSLIDFYGPLVQL